MRLKSTISPVIFDTYRRAARAFAATQPTDPFAYGRTLTHLLNGIAALPDVIADGRRFSGVAPRAAAPALADAA